MVTTPPAAGGPPASKRPSLWARLVSVLAAGSLLMMTAILAALAPGFQGCSRASPGEYYFLAAGAATLAVWALLRPRIALILGAFGVLGFVALPRLLAPVGPCNEETALADLRAVVAAQKQYAAANGGHFDGSLACLSEPRACIPDYTGPRESFLAREFVSERRGYVRTLTAGPAPALLPTAVSPTSVTAFALTAVPRTPGSGGRGLCADSSGAVCATLDRSGPALTPDGSCDLGSCTRLP